MRDSSYKNPQGLAGILILAGGLSSRMGSPKALLSLPSGESLLHYHVRHARQFGVPIIIADNGQGFMAQVEPVNSSAKAMSPIYQVLDYQPHCSNPEAKHKHSAGPLGAILAGMQQLLLEDKAEISSLNEGDSNRNSHAHSCSESKWMLVVSCDSLVNAGDIWQYLADQTDQTEQKVHGLAKATPVNEPQSLPPLPQMYCLMDNERDYPLLAVYQLALSTPLKDYLDKGERRVMGFIRPISQSIPMPQAWYTLCNLNTPEQFQSACQQV